MTTPATNTVARRSVSVAAYDVEHLPDRPPGTGCVLVRNPGDPDWRWAEYPLKDEGDFGLESLQAMAGGPFDYMMLGHGLGLVYDGDALRKRLPFCMVFRMPDGGLFPLVGPVALVRATSRRMRPLRIDDCRTFSRRFDWSVA